jgi:hypothetical protein
LSVRSWSEQTTVGDSRRDRNRLDLSSKEARFLSNWIEALSGPPGRIGSIPFARSSLFKDLARRRIGAIEDHASRRVD